MSLKIEKKNEGTKDTVFLTGRLDTTTAAELDTYCQSNDCGCKDTELHSEKEDSIYLN